MEAGKSTAKYENTPSRDGLFRGGVFLSFFLDCWQVDKHRIRRRHCGDGGADEADGGEVAGACDKAAERRAAADADVEEAGVDGRRDGGARAARRAQELGLAD